MTDPNSKDPAGKIEDLLTGKSLEDNYSSLNDPHLYREVAKKFAKLHSLTKQQMPVKEKERIFLLV